MVELPATRPSLLIRIRDAKDPEAWRQFVHVYAPVVYRYARGRGLQDADAADLTQDVLRAVAGSIGRLDYDPRRGSFGGWLFAIARHRLHDALARLRQGRGTGETTVQDLLEQHPDRNEDAALWEHEYRRRLFTWAAELVRPKVRDATWKAFWMTAVEGWGGQEVADALGLTVAAVYLAKSRVMARLREQIEQWERE